MISVFHWELSRVQGWDERLNSTNLPIRELNNSPRCWKEMRHTSSTTRSTILKFLTMAMAELPLKWRVTFLSIRNRSFPYTKKHTTCLKEQLKENESNWWILISAKTQFEGHQTLFPSTSFPISKLNFKTATCVELRNKTNWSKT